MWQQLIGNEPLEAGKLGGSGQDASVDAALDRPHSTREDLAPLTLRQGGFDINEPLAESVVELLGKLRSTAGKVLAFANVVL